MKQVKDEAVLEVQIWINATYGEQLLLNGYGLIDETGYTGWDTVYGLIIGLQIELGVSIPNLAPSFGPTTIGLLNAYGDISQGSNDTNGNIN